MQHTVRQVKAAVRSLLCASFKGGSHMVFQSRRDRETGNMEVLTLECARLGQVRKSQSWPSVKEIVRLQPKVESEKLYPGFRGARERARSVQ